MRRPLLALLALTTACAHRAPEPAAAEAARAAFAAEMTASAHDRRHQSISMLEGMLGLPATPVPAPGSPGH